MLVVVVAIVMVVDSRCINTGCGGGCRLVAFQTLPFNLISSLLPFHHSPSPLPASSFIPHRSILQHPLRPSSLYHFPLFFVRHFLLTRPSISLTFYLSVPSPLIGAYLYHVGSSFQIAHFSHSFPSLSLSSLHFLLLSHFFLFSSLPNYLSLSVPSLPSFPFIFSSFLTFTFFLLFLIIFP